MGWLCSVRRCCAGCRGLSGQQPLPAAGQPGVSAVLRYPLRLGLAELQKEVNTGEGLKVQDWMRGYLTYVLPLIVVFIFAFGLYDKFLA